ncbi:hypothetical protein ACFQT0_13140 [Hymenobacter humi]|uniref:Glycosyl hydrolase family 13 catalytic domain-containing protein n=1 Tax=Hymenobacter humi TaxID=1411620 RepID=A0ABW2U7L5_9BACT
MKALTAHEDADRDMLAVAQALTQTYNDDAFRRVIYTESHDEVANGKSRVPEEIMPGDAAHWFPKSARRWARPWCSRPRAFPCCFRARSFWPMGRLSIPSPCNGSTWPPAPAWCTSTAT